ncbi:MAG: hypothetical protein QNJ53_20585 [Pleurocapsa sp. MO_192.B19]|nr:hypothetical protein [Pleurocapsa sp. MO_192.B19]
MKVARTDLTERGERLYSPSTLPTHKPDLTKIRSLLKADTEGAIGWASFSESHEYSVTIR